MSEAIKVRKKVCYKCGRKLWLRDFYKRSDGTYSTPCKECQRKQKKDWYDANRKKPDGVFYDFETGRMMEHQGARKRIFWNENMLSVLKRYFPNTKNEEVAEMCGVSLRTVIRKARELGLQKDKNFVLKVWDDNRLLAVVKNRRNENSGMMKKGHIPWNKGKKLKAEAI